MTRFISIIAIFILSANSLVFSMEFSREDDPIPLRTLVLAPNVPVAKKKSEKELVPYLVGYPMTNKTLSIPELVGRIGKFLDVESLMNMARGMKTLNLAIKKGKFYQLSKLIQTTNFRSVAKNDDPRLEAIFKLLHAEDTAYMKARMANCLMQPIYYGRIRNLYKKAAEAGSKEAITVLNLAAYTLGFGFKAETARQYLEDRTKAGDQDAQWLLNQAAYDTKLGFMAMTARQYLEDRTKASDQGAQWLLNLAAYNLRLCFGDRTGRQYLEDRIKVGDSYAQQLLNQATYDARLGFTDKIGRQLPKRFHSIKAYKARKTFTTVDLRTSIGKTTFLRFSLAQLLDKYRV